MRCSLSIHILAVVLLWTNSPYCAEEEVEPLSLSLEQAIHLALETNQEIQVAAKETEAASARIHQAESLTYMDESCSIHV